MAKTRGLPALCLLASALTLLLLVVVVIAAAHGLEGRQPGGESESGGGLAEVSPSASSSPSSEVSSYFPINDADVPPLYPADASPELARDHFAAVRALGLIKGGVRYVQAADPAGRAWVDDIGHDRVPTVIKGSFVSEWPAMELWPDDAYVASKVPIFFDTFEADRRVVQSFHPHHPMSSLPGFREAFEERRMVNVTASKYFEEARRVKGSC